MRKLITVASVLLIGALAGPATASAWYEEGEQELRPGTDLSDAPRVVGGRKAVCSVRKCVWRVSCEGAEERFPGFLTPGCGFFPALVSYGDVTDYIPFLTTPEGARTVKPVYLGPGESKKLKLRTSKTGRLQIKYALKRGKSKLRKGGFEALRADITIQEEYDGFDGLPSGYAKALANDFDSTPGWFTFHVSFNQPDPDGDRVDGYAVFNEGDVKIRIK